MSSLILHHAGAPSGARAARAAVSLWQFYITCHVTEHEGEQRDSLE